MRLLDDKNFNEAISSENGVLVDFFAPWCGPCRTMGTILEAMEEIQGNVCKVNIDDHPDLADRYGIRSVPTLIWFKSGVEADRTTGVISKDDIKKMMK